MKMPLKRTQGSAHENKNLLNQVLALYNHIFIDRDISKCVCRADEFFDITIGKTPPRKEHQWFSKIKKNITWISISDMGNSELYLTDSSEYLTPEAVKKFHVSVVPDDTVLLSFKLTVGRIGITDGAMTSNEAIAHFKTLDHKINPYLYCYLTNFNFQSLGNTSSIATAVNSKIIKAMPFVIPDKLDLRQFNEIAIPAFKLIKDNQREIRNLSNIRDSLLPRLMSGKLDVYDL